MSNNHITVGIYPNGDYKYNVVRDEDLEDHIEYNKTWRWGRLLYVDGVRVYDGCHKAESLPMYDALVKEVYEDLLKKVNLNKDTRPYV